jgi:Zn-dependent protease with chaperone function
MQFEADYYDGISPRAKRVLVSIVEDHFVANIAAADEKGLIYSHQAFDHAISACTIQSKLGQGKRLIDLPEGAHLETDFEQLEKHLPSQSGNGFWRVVHYAETHLAIIALALVCTIAASFAMLKYGVPVAAKYAAMATPPSIEKDLGKQTLYVLDTEKLGYFKPTALPEDKQTAIRDALSAMCKKTHTCPEYQLNFRKSKAIGANAFALPGGYMVITDELIALAESDDEITAVLAHELGHVNERHALRQTLQGTVAGLIILSITGDVSSIAAGLPALMINMSYTRELETEADQYALKSLNAACIPAKSFSTILSKLAKSHGDGLAIPEIISSHPDSKARVVPFDKAQGSCA